MSMPSRFVTGSPLRHVIIMTLTNSAGIMALFVVDLIDLLFLNMLGEQELAASIGFSAQILFFLTSISIGILVSIGVLVSQRIGAGETDKAKRMAMSIYLFSVIVSIISSALVFYYLADILQLLKAKGRTFELAMTYTQIILPSTVILTLSMVFSGALRALGDAKRSMYATLIGAVVNLILDPILIFGLDMGIAGAATASVAARFAMMFYAAHGALKIHGLILISTVKAHFEDFLKILKFAIPAMLTNLS
ncbi:MAG: MATE family efflux transporter, partial [Paracoccus sp. (in: a-proteobacteria)]